MKCRGDVGLIPHDQPVGHLVVVLPAFCPQIAPIGPFLLVRKYCAVYILRFDLFHGMEEVVGSIPIKQLVKCFRNFCVGLKIRSAQAPRGQLPHRIQIEPRSADCRIQTVQVRGSKGEGQYRKLTLLPQNVSLSEPL
jgi:hypothetical protein